jgi:hypothetical protein
MGPDFVAQANFRVERDNATSHVTRGAMFAIQYFYYKQTSIKQYSCY